jgi:hypothetical protein
MSVGTMAVSVDATSVGGGVSVAGIGVSVGGRGVSVGGTSVGTGVSVGTGDGTGVKVAVNSGRAVLVGVAVTCDRPPPPAAQPSNIRASMETRMIAKYNRYLIKQQPSQSRPEAQDG